MNGMRFRFTYCGAEATAINECDKRPGSFLNERTYQWLSLQIVPRRDVSRAELTTRTTRAVARGLVPVIRLVRVRCPGRRDRVALASLTPSSGDALWQRLGRCRCHVKLCLPMVPQ